MDELAPVAMIAQLLGGLALFLYGMEKMTDGLKAAAGKQMNTLLAKLTGNRILGALIWLSFIAQLAVLAQMISPVASHLEGMERLAEEVPRQIANAATVWAMANVVIFLPFAALFARLAVRIIPDRAAQDRTIIRPRYLDDELIRVPSMALQRARLELGHMGRLTEAMLAKLEPAFRSRDLGELSQQHDQIVVLRDAVVTYLQHVGRGELSDADAEEHADLLAATGEIETMRAAISRDLAPLAQSPEDADLAPSSETAELLKRLFQTVQQSARAALQALVERDEQAARLAQDDPDRLLKHRVQFEMIDRLRRIYSVAEHMAISVLPRGVLVGELNG